MDLKLSYICYKCMEHSYSIENRRRTHFHVTSTGSPFVCAECSEPFELGYQVRDIVKPSYICEACDKVFNSEILLKSHSYEHSNAWPYVCKVCGKGLATLSGLVFHKAEHTNKSNRHKSNLWHSAFTKKINLTRRMKFHDEQTSLRCDVCNKVCENKYSLKSHMAKHSHLKPHKCNVCHAAYKFKVNLTNHMNKHDEKNPFRCGKCSKDCQSKTDLERHMANH